MKHLRHAAIFLTAFALAGCRFDVSPAEFDVSADVGQAITESLEVRNTGDEPVEFSLVPEGARVTLSETSGILRPDATAHIGISAECESAGERHTDIAVTGRTGNKAIVVHVPFVLRCQDEAGAHLVSLELFQGPPIYKKDYRAGTETEPVTLGRPENGATPAKEWERTQKDENTGFWTYPSKDEAWSAGNNGFVTAIWHRRATVAVTVFHMDDSPLPHFSASVGGADLPVLFQETERDGDGFETVTVFEVDRALYIRGAELDISVNSSDDGDFTDSLALFGETVEPMQIAWIPIDVPEFPAPILDVERYTEGISAWVPIAERSARIGPTMQYQEIGDERPGARTDPFKALDQLARHHALHACGHDEVYIGYWDVPTMFETDGSVRIGGVALSGGYLSMAIGTIDTSVNSPIRSARMLNAHEVGHLFDLTHAPSSCGRSSDPSMSNEHPYNDTGLGPARGWDDLEGRFAGPSGDDEFKDFMGACRPKVVSDFSYQLMALYRQSLKATRTCENPRPESGVIDGKPSPSVLGSKSSPVKSGPVSVAVTGELSPEGIASISMAQPTGNSPWVPPETGRLMLEIVDTGGNVLHGEPVRSAHIEHGSGEVLWSARVPYFESAASVVLRGAAGEVRAESGIEAGYPGSNEIRE